MLRSRRPSCVMEPLEQRLLLSTTITYTPTSITVVGDTTKTGQISISGNAGGNYFVNIPAETPIVKGTPPAVSNKVSITVSTGNAGRTVSITPANAKNVTVNGGKGNDNITAGGNVFAGNVTINGGDGTNTLTVNFVDIVGNLVINGGKDGDTIHVATGATFVSGNTTIHAGDGGNQVTVENVNIRGKLTINGGKDGDTVTLGSGSSTSLLGNVSIDTKGGDDVVGVNQGTYGAEPLGKAPTTFSIKAGDGDDAIRIGGFSTPGAVVFPGRFSLDAGAGNDVVGIANSSSATTIDFENAATILMGAGNDFLQIASDHNSNNVNFLRNATIDLGASLASAPGDRFGVSVVGASQLAFSGARNTINLGSGIKNLATPVPGILADSIYLGTLTHTEIKASAGAVISSSLKRALLKGLNTTAANVSVTISLA